MTSSEFEKAALDEQEIEKLWQAFKLLDADGNSSICADELRQVMHSLGHSPTDKELHDLIEEVDIDSSGGINFEEFKALMISKHGDRQSRLKLAFCVFDENGNGQITASEMRSVMSQFGLTDEELDEIVLEVDHDGDRAINFEEFCQLVVHEPENTTGYKDTLIFSANSPPAIAPPNTTTATDGDCCVTPNHTAGEALSDLAPDMTQLTQQLLQQSGSEKKCGTSRLQMQIGLFRLIQGAAYRCFRESFSANHETHLRVKNLPYRISDFVPFVKCAIDLYKQLGIVEAACHPVLDAVVTSIVNEYARLEERIKKWETVEKTPQMLATHKAILSARSKCATVKEKFTAGVEFAITIKKQRLSLRDIASGVLALNELNRLRKMDLHEELTKPRANSSEENPKEYLQQWNRVIIRDALEEVDGAMMPVAYWYEEFMPKLLAAFSVSTAADIGSNTVPNEVDLDQWYKSAWEAGEFDRFGADVATCFPTCTPKQKLMLKQAWNLTHSYLNGVQKRRERVECGRESGALSQYVAFVDVYLGRSDIKNSQMRVSYPYYIGPAVWRFLHTSAEIICTKPYEQQIALVAIVKEFFKQFATLYPCPYCRHHLNLYVIPNREVEMYPVEYLLLGRDAHLIDFEVSLDAKLSALVDGSSLRLFFWKLHNTVSSSISRSEQWYRQDEKPFYTSRYWPSLDAELARAKILKQASIATDFLYRLYEVHRTTSRLAAARTVLQKLMGKGEREGIQEVCLAAQNYIKDLDEAVLNGQFLQEAYHFDPDLVDKAPYFTSQEEEYARSGIFIETALIERLSYRVSV